ncbi:general substrate transporter [Phyllosticta citrichinensis]|uniref:General substrate transporter n=1 Tax=Phyllosticta citrichinensis TaxID=1130410 RepID=A0ABR1XYR7_9PEZI
MGAGTPRGRFAAAWHDIKEYRRAYTLTAIASFGGMLFGWDTGLIGGVLTMRAFQQSFGLDPDSKDFDNLQGNIVSVLQGGCFFGAAASFWLSDKVGRRWSLILADLVFLIGSVIQTCCAIGTTSLAQLYVGRFIGGFGVGLISAIVPAYIGENANKEIRGRCIGTMQLFNVTGIMVAYFVNYGISKDRKDPTDSAAWRIPFALQMLPGLFLLVGIIFENESPRWLVEKDRFAEAKKALAFVRGRDEDDASVELEYEQILADFRGRDKLSLFAQMRAALCESKSTLFRTCLAVSLMFWQQATGTNSINYYSPQIFKNIGLGSADATLFATGIYGVVKVVFTGLALAIGVEQAGRKWSLIVGGLGQAFSMYYIGINQAVHPGQNSLTGNNIFAIVCVYLFVVFYSGGWGPVPFILCSECSPNHVRSFIMAASLMTQWLFNFVIAKLTPILLDRITYGTYLLFGTCCILMCFYALFLVPETKNVPLESIHLLFEGDIVAGALRDTLPRTSRARWLKDHRGDEGETLEPGLKRPRVGVGSSRKAWDDSACKVAFRLRGKRQRALNSLDT